MHADNTLLISSTHFRFVCASGARTRNDLIELMILKHTSLSSPASPSEPATTAPEEVPRALSGGEEEGEAADKGTTEGGEGPPATGVVSLTAPPCSASEAGGGEGWGLPEACCSLERREGKEERSSARLSARSPSAR